MLREICYTDLWLDYFRNDLLSINNYSSRAALVIGKKTQLPDESELATFEKLHSKTNPLTFAGQVHLHGNPMIRRLLCNSPQLAKVHFRSDHTRYGDFSNQLRQPRDH